MSRGSPLRTLLARLSAGVRARLLVAAVLGAVARISVVLAAVVVADGQVRSATLLGAVAAVAFAGARVMRTWNRTMAECDLYRSVARSWIAADVLSVPVTDPSHAIFEGSHQALSLVADSIPGLVSDAVAVLVVVPILASIFPARVLVIALLGAVAVLVCLAFVRRVSARLAERVSSARQRVFELVLTALEGRLELVMRGGEDAFAQKLEAALAEYQETTRRSAVAGALVGRAPILAGAAMVAAAVLFDGAARASVASVVLAQSVVLAACVPPFLGIVLGANELVRARSQLGPFLDILDAKARADVGRIGAAPPALPAEVRFDDVTFRYAADVAPVLVGLSSAWPPSGPLVLTGPNGAGKSTLLYLLGGLRAPERGDVRVAGLGLQTLDIHALRKRIAYLPQRPYLGESYGTVREAMLQAVEGADDAAMTAALAKAGVLEALAKRGSDPLAVRVGELSAGQRQRVALARIRLQNARIVLLDEPDANLDRAGIELVADMIRELTEGGVMVAVAAHTPELAELAAVRVDLARPN